MASSLHRAVHQSDMEPCRSQDEKTLQLPGGLAWCTALGINQDCVCDSLCNQTAFTSMVHIGYDVGCDAVPGSNLPCGLLCVETQLSDSAVKII